MLREDINKDIINYVGRVLEELNEVDIDGLYNKIVEEEAKKETEREEEATTTYTSDLLELFDYLKHGDYEREVWRSEMGGITVTKANDEYKLHFDKPIKNLIISPELLGREELEYELIDGKKPRQSTIVALIGASSSGKDTLLKEVLSTSSDVFKGLVSHTTRPMREGERNGNEYHFVTREEFLEGLGAGEFVEYRTYNVANGETWYYGLHDSEIDMESETIYMGIFDVNGYWALVEEYGEENVLPVYVDCDVVTRLERALERENIIPGSEKYREVLRRMYADSEEIEQYRDDFKTVFYNGDCSQDEFEDKVDCLIDSIIDFHENK